MAENACSGSCSGCASSENCGGKLAEAMKKIKHKILVLSGKGGVGKSTVAASLAVTLAKRGFRVGLLDVDFHGPSQPTLFAASHLRMDADSSGLLPLETAGGVKLVSIGLLIEESESAVIWRGPVKLGVLKQLLEDVHWGELDYLILDFPPGTGDEALSAVQTLQGDKKAIIVTTPQELSLADCRKCVDFCRRLELPVTGLVENMSYFRCGDCGSRHNLFSSGGGARLAELSGVPLLAELPLDPEFLDRCDHGNLASALDEMPEMGGLFGVIADKVAAAGAEKN